MVTRLIAWIDAAGAPADGLLWAAGEKAEPLITQLDPQSRAKLLMALLGLVLVGLGLIALVWLGGRRMLRIARDSHGPTRRYEDDWYRKPLVPKDSYSPSSPDRDPE